MRSFEEQTESVFVASSDQIGHERTVLPEVAVSPSKTTSFPARRSITSPGIDESSKAMPSRSTGAVGPAATPRAASGHD